MKFKHDVADTSMRRKRLEEYVHDKLLNVSGTFICRHCTGTCRPSAEKKGLAFIAGEMPHMGQYFSLIDDSGMAHRVVVVGQERGRGEPIISLADRTLSIQRKRDRQYRNPHLSATANALMLSFGLRPDSRDGEHIDVDGKPVHV